MEKIEQNSGLGVHVKHDEVLNLIFNVIKEIKPNGTPYQAALLEALTALNKLEKFVR